MNQILYTNTPKKGGTLEIKTVLRIFAIACIIFGLILVGQASYAMITKKGEESQSEPLINVTQSEDILNISIKHDKLIDKITYSWNGGEETILQGKGRKEIDEKIVIPTGKNTLLLKATDINGKIASYSEMYTLEQGDTIKPEIELLVENSKVKIVAVTKYFGLKSIIAGYQAGIRNFGESRAIEATKKIEQLPDEIRKNSTFHFIGHLQSNKVEKVVKYFDIIESVDSLKIAKAISKSACLLNKREKVLLQVNNAGEEQKSGFSKNTLKTELGEILSLKGIEVLGLMNMAPLGVDENAIEGLFKDIREFRDELEREFNVTLPELSMGMSNDYKIALREGATIIRIGRKLFK